MMLLTWRTQSALSATSDLFNQVVSVTCEIADGAEWWEYYSWTAKSASKSAWD
jgi:hypothetical protein